MSTLNGYLKPYAAESFAASGGYYSDANLTSSTSTRTVGFGDARYWDSIINLNSILRENTKDVYSSSSSYSHHLQSHHKEAVEDADDHLYYKLLEVDGIDVKDSGLRGRRKDEDRRVEEDQGLSSGAALFVASFQERSQDEESKHQTSSRFRPMAGSNINKHDDDDRGKNEKNDNDNDKKNNKGDDDGTNNNRRKNKLPRIDRISPSNGDIVQDRQTFRARVQSSSVTDVPVRAVYFQLTDSTGSKSDVLTVPRVSDNLYEITVDGFSDYQGTEWSFSLVAEDERGKECKSEDVSFRIVKREGDEDGGSNSFFDNNDNADHSSTGEEENVEEENEDDGGGGRLMSKKKATDSNWSDKGAIIGATGRILFEFDGSDETFVCSGTVIHDGAGGHAPDYENGRSIIQTAAHCAFSDVIKKFANKAIFIPDQESTLGSESDFDCFNDKYGCWYLSFAVVADGWTRSSFPNNVEVRRVLIA